jgi:hypothetical protein
MSWHYASAAEQRLMIAASAQVSMGKSLSGPWAAYLSQGQVDRAKYGYALSIARHASEVQHWAVVIMLACSGGEGRTTDGR